LNQEHGKKRPTYSQYQRQRPQTKPPTAAARSSSFAVCVHCGTIICRRSFDTSCLEESFQHAHKSWCRGDVKQLCRDWEDSNRQSTTTTHRSIPSNRNTRPKSNTGLRSHWKIRRINHLPPPTQRMHERRRRHTLRSTRSMAKSPRSNRRNNRFQTNTILSTHTTRQQWQNSRILQTRDQRGGSRPGSIRTIRLGVPVAAST